MERFRTCDECARHVRASESSCPFCGHVLVEAAFLPLVDAPAQSSRAQRIALVAALASGSMLAACGDVHMDPGERPVIVDPGVGVSAAGSGARGFPGAGNNGGQIGQPVYGAPLPPVAGQNGAAGRWSMIAPPYGATPPPPRAGRSGDGAGGVSATGGGGTGGVGGSSGAGGEEDGGVTDEGGAGG